MLRSLFLILCFPSFYANAMTFSEAITKIQEHDSVEALISLAQAQYSDAESRGSWGDPSFKIAVKNLPQESLKDDETPMSGVEFSLSQKVPLTTKYGNLKKSYQAKAKSIEFDVKDQKQLLAKSLWQILIYKRSVLSEITIFEENIIWINKMIDISKKLYANGKLSQKALLDLQIRQTEIESEINNKKFELLKISDNLEYLLSQKKIDDKSVPWQILEQKDGSHLDNREKSLKEKVFASEFRLKAAKQNYIPDLTLSVGITKRSNIDDQGDFLGASISFPLPISDDKYGMQKKGSF